MTTKVKLTNVRLSFPDLFEAVQFPGQADSEPRYNASFLIDPGSANDKAVQAAIQAEAAAEWDKKAASTLTSIKGNSNKYCYVSGDTKDYDGYAGMMCLSSHRKEKAGRPLVIDQQRNTLAAADGKPYAGCYVDATVEIYAQSGKFLGIRCSLLGVQFRADGDAFTAGSQGNVDDFEDIAEGADADAENYA